MFTIPCDVKEPTHYSKRVGHEVPGVVAVLCESTAGPHQLIAAKLNLLNQIKDRQTCSNNSSRTRDEDLDLPLCLNFVIGRTSPKSRSVHLAKNEIARKRPLRQSVWAQDPQPERPMRPCCGRIPSIGLTSGILPFHFNSVEMNKVNMI